MPREQTEEECHKRNCKHPQSYINPRLPEQKERAWLMWGNKHKGPTPHRLAFDTACFGSLQLCGGQSPHSCIDQRLAQYGTSPNPLTHWPRLSQPQAGGHRENIDSNGTRDNNKEMPAYYATSTEQGGSAWSDPQQETPLPRGVARETATKRWDEPLNARPTTQITNWRGSATPLPPSDGGRTKKIHR